MLEQACHIAPMIGNKACLILESSPCKKKYEEKNIAIKASFSIDNRKFYSKFKFQEIYIYLMLKNIILKIRITYKKIIKQDHLPPLI